MSIDAKTDHATRSQNKPDHSYDRCLQLAWQKIAHHKHNSEENAYRECDSVMCNCLPRHMQAP